MDKRSSFSTYKVVFIGVMAAIVCVVTFFRFPFLGSKVHFANAMCLLSGLMFGPVGGGLAAGFGSAIYDSFFGGYGFVDSAITFVSKFLMAFICALIAGNAASDKTNKVRIIIASVVGALSYVALYMLKTFVFQRFVYGFPGETVIATMASKLPASLINAVFAMIAAPLLFAAIKPVLKSICALNRIR